MTTTVHTPTAPAGIAPSPRIEFFASHRPVENMRTRSVRGGMIVLFAQAVRFAINMGSVAILARLLTPADYGLVAMTGVFIAFAGIFRDLGLSTATVQRQHITSGQVSALFWINAGLGTVLSLVAALVAPALALAFGEPRLIAVTAVLGLDFILAGLAAQHVGLLRRAMQFSSIAALDISGPALGMLVGIGLALAGAGYWALVAIPLVSSAVILAGAWTLCPWRPSRPRRVVGVRPMIVYGGNLTGFNVVYWLTSHIDAFAIGALFGPAALGLYSRAYELLLLPLRQINGPVSGVAVPVLSRLHASPLRFRSYYRTGLASVTMLGMPTAAFMFAAAPDLVRTILGAQWTDAAVIFRFMAPVAFVGTINVATGWIYLALGRADRQLRWGLVVACGAVVATIAGSGHGLIGIAVSVAGALTLLRLLGVAYCVAGTPVMLRDVGAAIWRPFVGSTTAAAVTLLVAARCGADVSSTARLGIEIAVFTATYALAWLLVPGGPAFIRKTLSSAGSLRRRKRRIAR